MITKNLSEFETPEGKTPFMAQISAMMKFGFSWRKEQSDQETFVKMIDGILNNECLLLRNVSLPLVETPIPLVLIAPAGLTIISPQSLTGTFQAQGNRWLKIDSKGDLVPDDPNPIRKILLSTRDIQRYLEKHDYQDLPIETIMAFTSAGAHIDNKNSSVRILLSDAIKNFARQIGSAEPLLSPNEIKDLAKLLAIPHLPASSAPAPAPDIAEEYESEGEGEFEKQSEDSPPLPETPNKAAEIIKKLGFSKRQWILLGGIFIGQVILIIIFLILVF